MKILKKYSKRLANFNKNIDSCKAYDLSQVIDKLFEYKDSSKAKFDESVDVVFNTCLDPKDSTQLIKSFADLSSISKAKKVLVFATGEDIEIAKSSGAIKSGSVDLINEIKNSKAIKYDHVIATTNMLPELKSIASILGPKGLMPNSKLGTVCSSADLSAVVKSFVLGSRVSLVLDKGSSIKCSIGTLSSSKEDLMKNLSLLYKKISENKPSSFKGVSMLSSVFLSSTMGSSFKVNVTSLNR